MLLLLKIISNLLRYRIVWVATRIHQIIRLERVVMRSSWSSCASGCRRVRHVLRNHVPVVLINRIILIAIRININFIEFVIDIRLEELFYHLSSVLGG